VCPVFKSSSYGRAARLSWEDFFSSALAFVGMGLLLGHDSFHPPMDKKEAANILMETLRAGNYGKALEILGPDR
jgi:hypothetical protein